MAPKSSDSASSHFPLRRLSTEMWTKILGYLSFGDIKQLRGTSRFHARLAEIPNVLGRSKLILSSENIDCIREYLQLKADGTKCMQILHVELNNLFPSNGLKYVLTEIGSHVESLVLNRAPVLESLNGRLPCLQRLSIGSSSYGNVSVSNSDDSYTIDLNSFVHLKILECAREGSSRIKARLLCQLTENITRLQLEQLQVELSTEHEKTLMRVLEAHAKTLKQLHIHICEYVVSEKDVTAWNPIWQQLSELQAIKLSGSCRYDWLENIFLSLPEQCSLVLVDLHGIKSVNDVLLTFIATKWSASLQRVSVNCGTGVSKWGLVQLSNSLVDLTLSYCAAGDLVRAIAHTRNTVLKRLYLINVLQLGEDDINIIATRLPNLVALALVGCKDAVTNRSLPNVFRFQAGLQMLALDNCINISDNELIGTEQDPWPISRLTDLRWLSLRGCRKISERSLQHGLKLSSLRYLKVGFCNKILRTGLKHLSANCPAIENLAIASCTKITDDTIQNIVKGFKRLRTLQISHCFNLTQTRMFGINQFNQSHQELDDKAAEIFSEWTDKRHLVDNF